MRFINILICFVMMLGAFAPAITYADVQEFDILASVRGKDPQDAQERAIDYAKKRGFYLMLAKFSPEKAEEIARSMTTEQIYKYVRGYEVLQEKFTGNHYLGNFRVSVSADLVKRLIAIDKDEIAGEYNPILMMPVLDDAGQIFLWEGGNLWRSIWNTVALEKGDGILVMPYGDPTDTLFVDSSTILSYDFNYLQSMAARYGAGEVVVARARYQMEKEPHGVLVTLRRLGPKIDKIKDIYFEAEGKEETVEMIMLRAAKEIAEQLKEVAKEYQGEQKRRIVESTKQRIEARFRRLNDWVEMHSKLIKLPRVVQFEVDAINIRNATGTLYHDGESAMMLKILQANGFRVNSDGKIWVVSMY
ncbi:MAG: DUF2066 domain-containing protein [Rickettsiales bacterium]|nr:DUF2066 domain-containing protein [Rickettsiales bacterium]